MLPWWPDVTIAVPCQLSPGSIHDYLFCCCTLVGILFEVLRIVQCTLCQHKSKYSHRLALVRQMSSVYLFKQTCGFQLEIIITVHTWIVTHPWMTVCIVLCCIVLYWVVLCCIALYCVCCLALHYIVLYWMVLYCIALNWIVLYCVVLCCIILYCIILYCIVCNCTVLCYAINTIDKGNFFSFW